MVSSANGNESLERQGADSIPDTTLRVVAVNEPVEKDDFPTAVEGIVLPGLDRLTLADGMENARGPWE